MPFLSPRAAPSGPAPDRAGSPAGSLERLDAAMREAREKKQYKKMKRILKEHLEANAALVFDHTFVEHRLGFTIALARYGPSGREFVEVASTSPACAAFDALKPTDELVAINGDLLVDDGRGDLHGTATYFDSIRRRIRRGNRPMTLTFIRSGARETAFEVQEQHRLAAEAAFGAGSDSRSREGTWESDAASRRPSPVTAPRSRAGTPTPSAPSLPATPERAGAPPPLRVAITRIEDDDGAEGDAAAAAREPERLRCWCRL